MVRPLLSVPFYAFLILLVAGFWLEELDALRVIIFLVIWAIFLTALMYFGCPPQWFTVVQVVLDIILIFMIFGGDIRIR